MTHTTKKNLFDALLETDFSDVTLIQGDFAQMRGDKRCMCPLTTLCVKDGWWTETQVKLLLQSKEVHKQILYPYREFTINGSEILSNEIMMTIEMEYEGGELAQQFWLRWDNEILPTKANAESMKNLVRAHFKKE